MDDLDRIYRATLYRVLVPGEPPIDLRIDESSARLDALLAKRGVRDWAFVTAWNPGSQPLSEAENRARQDALRSLLRERALDGLDCSGVPSDASWQAEESVLVFGIAKEEAVQLGRRFGQVAIVAGTAGGAAELVYCDSSASSRPSRLGF